jgi:hypothetical protein
MSVFALTEFIRPRLGVTPPSDRAEQSSSLAAPASCATQADSTESVHISTRNDNSLFSGFESTKNLGIIAYQKTTKLMKPTLLVLAAGMGSRYGGNKQLDQVGPSGETIIDYSIYDAKRAGFGKVVFVIRRDIEEQFKETFVRRLENVIEIDYVFQELGNLPDGFSVPEGRQKPWGTSHAILVTESKIREPFGVINSDDYYGVDSFKVLYDFLTLDTNDTNYCIVGYRLGNTLSDHGQVNHAGRSAGGQEEIRRADGQWLDRSIHLCRPATTRLVKSCLHLEEPDHGIVTPLLFAHHRHVCC